MPATEIPNGGRLVNIPPELFTTTPIQPAPIPERVF